MNSSVQDVQFGTYIFFQFALLYKPNSYSLISLSISHIRIQSKDGSGIFIHVAISTNDIFSFLSSDPKLWSPNMNFKFD